FNTAVGQQALVANVAGNNNTAVETFALGSNLGDDNTAVGLEALDENTTGAGSTAIGDHALAYAYPVSYTTAFGYEVGGGKFGVAIGSFAGSAGDSNTASGYYANHGDGHDNTATGVKALTTYSSAIYNT